MTAKKKVIICIICIFIIVLSVITVKFQEWGKQKTEWKKSIQSDAIISEKESGMGFELKPTRDFYYEADISVDMGSVMLYLYFDDELLLQQKFEKGNSHFESRIYEQMNGNITTKLEGSVDSSGYFSDTIYTRETNGSRFLRRLKIYFFGGEGIN